MRTVLLFVVLAACSERDEADEVARLRHHFATVLGELRAADTSELDASQLEARERALARLEHYSNVGVFPHNHALPYQTPVFVDEHGTRCAVAYLIEQSGDPALVARIAMSRVYAYVPELADDPEVVAWLDRNGLTLAETTRIQPSYGPQQEEDPYVTFYSLSGVVLAADGAAIAANLRRDAGPASGAFGVVAGTFSLAMSIPRAASNESPSPPNDKRVLIGLDLTVGAATLVLGVRTMLRPVAKTPVAIAPTLGHVNGFAVAGSF